jgi:DNA-binding protein Fis
MQPTQPPKVLVADDLQRAAGNKAQAARLLGIDYKTLHMKLNKYDLRRKEEVTDDAQPAPR